MFRPVLCAAVLAGLMTACSDKPSPATNAPPKSAAPQAVAPKPIAPVDIVSPTQKVVFASLEDCAKAKYTPGQCTSARDVALAMVQDADSVYETKEACEVHFKECIPAKSKPGKEGFYPKMHGFSLGGEKPGVERKPSATAPIFYAPVYKNNKGEWVYLLVDQNGGLLSNKVQ